MIAMAKAKKKAAPKGPPHMLTKGFRMTAEYAEWLDRLAKSERMPIATLIDRTLADYAKERGFDPPPERIP